MRFPYSIKIQNNTEDFSRPLKIRTDIRDQFEAPTCAVQKAFKTLEGIIGLKVSCNLEWEMLWTELEPRFPDKATFVPNVAGVIAAWCEALGARLEDDRFANWTEDLLGKLESVRSVKIHVQVCNTHKVSFSPQIIPSGVE